MGQYRSKIQEAMKPPDNESDLETFIGEECSASDSRDIEFVQSEDEDTCSRSDDQSQQQIDSIFSGLYQGTQQDFVLNLSVEMSDISDIHVNKDIITPFCKESYFTTRKLQENQNQTEIYNFLQREPEILSIKEYAIASLPSIVPINI